MNKIVAFQLMDKSWRIKVDGIIRNATYIDTSDVREWLGCLQAHGLYLGYKLYRQTDTGALVELTPTYNHPVNVAWA